MTSAPAGLHALLISLALAWHLREPRPHRGLAWAAVVLAVVTDVLLILTPTLPGLVQLAAVGALALGGALLLVVLLGGGRSRSGLVVGILAFATPFAVFLAYR